MSEARRKRFRKRAFLSALLFFAGGFAGQLLLRNFLTSKSLLSPDAVVGLSNGPASDYTALATIARFNSAGYIDARNGGVYSANSNIPYSAGTTYRFRVVVNVGTRRYSLYVQPGAGAEMLVADNYAFRTEQGGASKLDNVAANASSGSVTVCNPAIQ